MKLFFWTAPLITLTLSFSSCSNQGSGDDPLGTGPYDSAGNYREDWADDPRKWSKPGKRTPTPIADPPMIAANDQPPASSTPISSTPRVKQQPVEVASRTRSNDSSAVKRTTRPSSPKTTVKSSGPKSTTKKSVAKAKPKPKVNRYTVKKGDSLSTIASRNGSSVSAIQKANSIKGTLIRPGQSLVVPKR